MRAGAHTKKFWPFTPWNGAAAAEAPPAAAAQQPASIEKDASAPEPETVASVREGIMASEQFQQKVAPFCKDVKPAEFENCKAHMGERLWCALFARNIQRFLTTPGKNEERTQCQSINKEASADWFMHATWQLRGSLVQRRAQVSKASGRWWPFASAAAEPTPAAEEQMQKPTAAPVEKWQPKKTVAMTRADTIASPEFQHQLAPFCKDAPAKDLEKCKTYMGERLWCAMFARNIQKFLLTEGKAEEKDKCDGINAMKGADWFTHATWQLRFLQQGQRQHWSPFTTAPVAPVQRAEPKTKAGEALDGDSPALNNDPNSFGSSAAPTVAETRAGVMATPEFKNRIAPFCNDDTAADFEHCKGYTAKRMWCAVFARNIQLFLSAEGKAEERKKCEPVNKMEGADWFMHSSYQLHL